MHHSQITSYNSLLQHVVEHEEYIFDKQFLAKLIADDLHLLNYDSDFYILSKIVAYNNLHLKDVFDLLNTEKIVDYDHELSSQYTPFYHLNKKSFGYFLDAFPDSESLFKTYITNNNIDLLRFIPPSKISHIILKYNIPLNDIPLTQLNKNNVPIWYEYLSYHNVISPSNHSTQPFNRRVIEALHQIEKTNGLNSTYHDSSFYFHVHDHTGNFAFSELRIINSEKPLPNCFNNFNGYLNGDNLFIYSIKKYIAENSKWDAYSFPFSFSSNQEKIFLNLILEKNDKQLNTLSYLPEAYAIHKHNCSIYSVIAKQFHKIYPLLGRNFKIK